MLPKMNLGKGPNEESIAWYLFIWGMFSIMMFIGTLKSSPWSLVFVFFLVVVLFFLLAAENWTGNINLGKAAGIVGIVCGSSAIYTASGEILNDVYGRTILPLFKRKPPAPKKKE